MLLLKSNTVKFNFGCRSIIIQVIKQKKKSHAFLKN